MLSFSFFLLFFGNQTVANRSIYGTNLKALSNPLNVYTILSDPDIQIHVCHYEAISISISS